jgi:hypothetical protein
VSGPRRTLTALAGVLALFVAMGWLSAGAWAQSGGNISITSAGPDGSGDPYDLTVVADDANGLQLSGMTVHFLQGSNDVYDVTDMQYDSGSPDAQTWSPPSSSPIPEDDLPAGTYTMTVDATDADETDTGLAAGTIQITYSATNITVTPSQSDVSEGSQSVTFTGSVSGTAEDGTQVPMPGVQVNVSDGGSATTNGNGNFSYTASGISQSTNYDFTVAAAGDGSYPGGDSGPVPITAEQATTSVQVNAGTPVYSAGSESITFTGSVTAVSPINSASVPVTGATIDLTTDGGSDSLGGVATTDSNGDFTYTATGVTATTDYSFSVNPTSLYTGNSDDVEPGSGSAAVTNLAASPPQVTQGSNTVTITGTVTVTPPGGTATGAGSGVPVFLSIGGVSQGQVATTTDANGDFSYSPSAGVTQTTDYDFTVAPTSLYGTVDDGTVQVTAVASATTMAVTPAAADITLGSQSATFTGTVTILQPGVTTPVSIGAGIPIDLTGATDNPVAKTNASGQFTYTATSLDASTTYTFTVGGTNLYTAASAPAAVDAEQAQTTIGVPPAVVTFGSPTATLSGSVQGLPPGGTASLPISGALVTVNGNTGPTTDTNGNFSYTTGDLTQDTTYDFTTPAGNLYTAGDSGKISVNVDQGQTAISPVTTNPAVIGIHPQDVTFSGHVSVTPYGSTTAEPIGKGTTVDVSVNGTAATPVATDDASGDFTDTIPGVTAGMVYTFSVGSSALYTQASQSLAFGKDETKLAVVPSRQSVSEGAQSVTFNGTLTGTATGGSPEPITGAAVDLGTKQVATTGDDGKFSYTVSGISRAASYAFSVAGTSTYVQASTSVPIAASPARTRFAAISLSPAHLKYGQKATMTGAVQYLIGKKWVNLPRAVVHLAEGRTSLGTARSNGKGTFTATLPTTHGFGWSATVNSATLIQQASAVGNLTIAVPTKLQSYGISLGVDSEISASGCLEVTVPVGFAPLTKMAVQYEASTRGPWRTLGDLPLLDVNRGSSCTAATQSHFSGAIHIKLANAYYRLDFPGNDSFEPTSTKVVHLSKNPTRITSYKVSPRSVRTGQTITATGQLWVRTGRGWRPYAGQWVKLIANDKGTKFWQGLGRFKTNSRGDFFGDATAGKGTFVTIIYAEYQGSSANFEVVTPGDPVSITQRGSAAIAAVGTGDTQPAAGEQVILDPEQAVFASAVQQVLTATGDVTEGFSPSTRP